jgi:CPA1 family monovalent cation:H+ antiporter
MSPAVADLIVSLVTLVALPGVESLAPGVVSWVEPLGSLVVEGANAVGPLVAQTAETATEAGGSESGHSGLVEELESLIGIFVVAAAVGTFVAKVGRFPYTIALLLAGIVVGVIVSQFDVTFNISLTHDIIILVILPVLLFEGSATTDLERLRRNLAPILVLAIVGLIVAVVLLGVAGTYAFGYPLLISLLFAAMVLPTDPVSVLALFEELGAPERLSVLVEGESLINDGVGVVLFSTLIVFVEEGQSLETLYDPVGLFELAINIAVTSLGGAVVGFVTGYVIYRVMANLDEQMTEIVLTLILAYGSFLLAEELHVSGVIAAVVAGLLIGNQGAEYAMSPRTKVAVFNTWETAAFVVNTFIFVAIGIQTPIQNLLQHLRIIVIAIVLVLLARAAVVYPLTAIVNRRLRETISLPYQHVMLWGGLHGSIPIALVLGLPQAGNVPGPFPREELTAMVFGVAAFSLVVQGLTMSNLMNRLGIVTRTEAEELYELLTGRARAVKQALNAAERLHRRGDIPSDVYEDFKAEYGQEHEELNDAVSELLQRNPELRYEQLLVGERQVLRQEKSAIMDASRSGIIADDVAERLSEEVDLKLDRVRDGESTVHERGEGYREFWREQAADFGLDTRLDREDLEPDGDTDAEADGPGDGPEDDDPR